MKTRGMIKGFSRDYESGNYQMTLEVDSRAAAAYEALKGKDIDVNLCEHKTRRSLDQNAMYWSIVGEIATAIKVSNPVMHNMLLRRYGFPLIYDGQVVYAMIPDGADEKVLQDEQNHLKPTGQTRLFSDGTVRRTYMVLRGSHSYDTKEMNRLIDGAVSEAKEMGVKLSEVHYPG